MTITMRFSHALIFQVLWTILIALTQFQSVRGRACQPGWFGSNCQYKCHCRDTTCDVDGMCGGGGLCERGWFGPGCQYVDLVYKTSTERSQSWLTDDNNNTCNSDQSLQALTVNLTSEFPFTWLRLQVNDPSFLQNFQVTFSNRNNQVSSECKNMRNATVNERTLDVHCDLDVTVQTVTLTGEGVKSLCSLYISGGRNVALRQSTSQSSTYFDQKQQFLASSEKAVDGDVSGKWEHKSCSHTDSKYTNPTWNVTFSQEQRITRYVLYNRDVHQERLQKFTLTSFAKNGDTVFKRTDFELQPLNVYTIYNALGTSPIFLVTIQANSKRLILTLCEVELYGDSVCPPSKYGRECQYTCNCAVKNETCFVSTGGCPSGCSPGFQGESCNQPCDLGKYGEGCKPNCSQFCVTISNSESPCYHIDGRCLHGCHIGYQTPNCDYDTLTVSALLNTSAAVYNFIMDVKTNGNISQDSKYNKLYRLENWNCMKSKQQD